MENSNQDLLLEALRCAIAIADKGGDKATMGILYSLMGAITVNQQMFLYTGMLPITKELLQHCQDQQAKINE